MNLFANLTLWVAYFLSLYFSVFFLLIFLDKKSFFKKEKQTRPKLKVFPLVSILIPAYNEEKTIIKTIQSVLNLDYPQDKLQVTIINDGSTDQTKQKVQEFIKDMPNTTLISHQNMGKAASLNQALRTAQGEFFACLDADSFVHKKTLKKMLSFYYQENNPNLAIITPAMKVKKPKKILQKIQWIEYLIMIFIARLSSQIDSLYVAPGPFSLYKTKLIKKLGGFDEHNLTEDQEIAYRVQKHNYQIKHCFDGYVYTLSPGTLKDFYKQRRRWYQGSLSCLYKYKKIILNREYGDFGIIQLTKNILGFLLALTGFSFAFYFILLPLFQKLSLLSAIKFDLWPFLNKFTWALNFLNFEFKKIFIFIFLISITLLFLYLAHKNAREKLHKYGIVHLIPYFALYYLLKGAILIFSLISLSLGKKTKW